jgi:WD40 repeat protein
MIMDIFEIIIQRQADDGCPVVAEYHQTGEFLSSSRKEGLLRLDAAARQELQAQSINPLAYGTVLGRALFQEQVRDAFMQARTRSQNNLRVLLVIEDAGLRSLHWESLCGPIGVGGRWAHLALDQRVLFSHYLPSLAERRVPAIGRADLRALVVVANPAADNKSKIAAFDGQTTLDSVRQALGGIPHTALANVPDADGPATLDEICARITAQQYTILHVVAHGWYRASDGETIVYLLDDTGQIKPAPATRLIERLDQLQGARGLPHLVFLSTCESAAPEAEREGALGGLAQRLVRELGMPAVIAMTRRISISTANALAASFYERLSDHGEVDRAIVEAGVRLADAEDIVVPALYGRLGGRPLFSDTLDRELTDTEIEFGLGELARLLPERAPVLLDRFAGAAKTVRDSLGADRAALSEAARAEWNQAQTEINALCVEMLDLNFRAVSLKQKIPVYNKECPFPGLAAFQPQDRRFFFGREAIVQKLCQRLDEHPFLAVLGGSGSGKSSLVLAGVAPALQERYPGLRVASMTPGDSPLANLDHALSQSAAADTRILLVVDQFEEIFTLCTDIDQRRACIDRLLRLAAGNTPNENAAKCMVVLTMRADFWGECAPYPSLKAAMQQHQELLAPMNTAELRSAMEQQSAVVGLRFEDDLSYTILHEVEDEPGAMPLLQHLLREMWKRRHGRWLLSKEYYHVGGIQKAITQTAEDVYASLLAESGSAEAQQQTEAQIRNIFVRLTRLDERSVPGERQRNTRQRVAIGELVPAGSNLSDIRRLVNRLADARLIRSTYNAASGQTEVEVTHEALIRNWTRLIGWLDENRASLRLRESINEASEEWEKHSGPDADSYLVHQGGRLEDAETLRGQARLALNQLENDYLDACIQRRDRQTREKEARNLVFVVNDLLKDDLTRAIRMAQAAYCLDQNHSLPQVSQALSAAYYAAIRSQSSFYVANLRHKGAIHAAIYSPDGQMILTASDDGSAKLWDCQGRLLQTMEQGANLRSAAFAPNGAGIVTTGFDYRVKMWDADGIFIKDMVGHGPAQFHDIDSVAFSPDSQTIVTVGADHRAILWNAAGELLRMLEDHYDIIRSVVVAPDGQYFVTCGAWNDSTARLYRIGGELVAELGMDEGFSKKQFNWQCGISSAAFSPDSQLIVTTSHDLTAKMWDIAGNHIKTLRTHTADVNQVVFSPDGQLFVTVSDDRSAIIWTRDGEVRKQITGHDHAIMRVAYSPQHDLIATGDADGSVKIWNLDGALLANLNGHSAAITALAFAPDGAYILSGSADRTAKIWKALPPTQMIFKHDGQVAAAVFIPDAQDARTAAEILTVSGGQAVLRWNAETGALLNTYGGFGPDNYGNQLIFSLDVSSDGKRFVTTSTDYLIRVWDIAASEPVSVWNSYVGESCESNGGGWCGAKNARFSFDGAYIVTSDFGGQVMVWDRDGAIVRQFARQPDQVSGVAISRDNKYIVSAGKDKIAQLWSFDTGELIARFEGHRSALYQANFTPDDQYILTASADYTAKLWDLEGHMQLDLDRHTNETWSAACSADGQYIITASSDGTAKIWDRAGKLISTIDGGAKGLRSAYFSPDGQAVLTASSDGTARLWLLPQSIAAELQESYADIYRLTDADLDEYGLDPIVGSTIAAA